MRGQSLRRALASVLLSSALLAGCGTTVVNPVTGREERTVMDEAAEIDAGKQAHQQVLAEYGAYAEPKLQAYVNAVGQKLAMSSHRSALPWTFTVLDSPRSTPSRCPAATSTSRAA
jgi:predicted Zn-dependent protease